jgi:iron complex transport system permease protein
VRPRVNATLAAHTFHKRLSRWGSKGPVLTAALLLSLAVLWFVAGWWTPLIGEDVPTQLVQLRIVRALAGFTVGAALSVAGVAVQGLFRNPLASPSILGTAAGASFGGQMALMTMVWITGTQTLPGFDPGTVLFAGCLLGALGALAALIPFVRRGVRPVTLLLCGFILSAFFLSLGSFLLSLAQNQFELGRAIVAFSLGSVSSVDPKRLLGALPIVAVSVVALYALAPSLDLLLSGEDEAQSLGVDVAHLRRWTVVWTALLTGAAVAIGGTVGFVGLVVPHALRQVFGWRHRTLIPAALLGGGLFVMAADGLVRLVPSSSEVPLGVITGLVGAPLFLVLLIRGERELGLD